MILILLIVAFVILGGFFAWVGWLHLNSDGDDISVMISWTCSLIAFTMGACCAVVRFA